MYAGVQLGGGSWGQGRFRSLRRGALCAPASGISCGWDGGRRTPHPPRLAPPHLPPTGGRLWGRLEACGRSWASAQGRGLPPPVSGMFCDWYGGRRPPHPPRLAPRHLPPCGGKAFGAAGSLREILGLCAGAGLAPACLWHVLRLVWGEEDPSSVTARAAAPSPHRGKAFGAAGSRPA